MYATRKQWPVQSIEVRLQFNPEGVPVDRASEIRRDITLRGDLDADQRARLLQIANACPLHKILTGTIRVSTALAG
jgi:putative redox protein